MILLNDAFASQSKIGWRNFLKGGILKKWRKLLTPKRKNDVIFCVRKGNDHIALETVITNMEVQE
jgi:hypothetical protein